MVISKEYSERPHYYYLDGDTLVPVEDLLDPRIIEQFNEPGRRRIGGTYLTRQGKVTEASDGKLPADAYVWISTVFLVIDHSFTWDEEPVLFETMVFPSGDFLDEYCRRYHTVTEAREGHAQVVKLTQTFLSQHETLEGLYDYLEQRVCKSAEE